MSGRGGRLAVLGAAGACAACCAAPVAAAAAGVIGSAVTLVYPAAGVLVLALAVALGWRHLRKKRAAQRHRRVTDLPPGIPISPARREEQA
jgi:hypothetical protein